MWHRVAERLSCTVPEAQARLTSREFGEECAKYRIEPWDGSRLEYQLALIAAHIFSWLSGKPQALKKFAPYLDLPDEADAQDEDEMMAIMEAHRGTL
jgi:hypothetical protein